MSPLARFHRPHLRLLACLVIALGCGRSPVADAPPTAPPAPTAANAAGSGNASDPLTPELVSFPSGSLTLAGYLYKPSGSGPFPAVVFNHGSEAEPSNFKGQAMFYVKHGFVLFVPHRRGQGQSKAAGPYVNNLYFAAPDSADWVNALVAQSDDVIAAIAYVAALPYVDKARIATAGCSFGGIVSLLAAERGTGIVAAVDFAGAAITWSKSAPLRERMTVAARNAKVPVFFIQAENDYDTAPSQTLSAEMTKAGKPMRVHIFPPNGTTPQQGHGFCRGGDQPPWGDEVLAFLSSAMPAR